MSTSIPQLWCVNENQSLSWELFPSSHDCTHRSKLVSSLAPVYGQITQYVTVAQYRSSFSSYSPLLSRSHEPFWRPFNLGSLYVRESVFLVCWAQQTLVCSIYTLWTFQTQKPCLLYGSQLSCHVLKAVGSAVSLNIYIRAYTTSKTPPLARACNATGICANKAFLHISSGLPIIGPYCSPMALQSPIIKFLFIIKLNRSLLSSTLSIYGS